MSMITACPAEPVASHDLHSAGCLVIEAWRRQKVAIAPVCAGCSLLRKTTYDDKKIRSVFSGAYHQNPPRHWHLTLCDFHEVELAAALLEGDAR